MKKQTISVLKTGAAPLVLGLALIATPALAQDASADCTADPQAAGCDEGGQTIVVTGSILRRTDLETPSPVTTVSVENLDKRGVSTIQEGLQRIASNNGPALTNSFSANGAFAGGASAVSLRGLTTSSTLVLFDGMRAAYYPLADDGTRNFVDLNTIPDDIVEKIEVLRDGASSAYGADAIAGVVNIITKREFKGIAGRVEAGISSRGDAAQQRVSATVGFGDLAENGINAYVSGFYYKSDLLKAAKRPSFYGTDDLSTLCTDGVCDSNDIINGLQPDGYTGGFGFATPFVVRPRNATTGGAAAGQSSRYEPLNGCGNFPSYNPTAAELALQQNTAAGTTVCQEDLTNLYGVISPDIERFGGSARFTAIVGEGGEAYAEMNFLQTSVSYTGFPSFIRANAPAPFYSLPRYSTSANVLAYGNNTALQLPVFVCAARVNCATAADGRLNPNNPFAAQGFTAGLGGRIPNLLEHDSSRTRAFRGAAGIRGPITDKISYDVAATAMHVDLQRKSSGYVYIQHLLDVIADGSYNFVNPGLNSQATLDYLAPTSTANSTSDLFQLQGVVSATLLELPGGPLEVGVGASVRYEAIDSPSQNSDFNGPTERYFRINGFAAKGNRTVTSIFAEAQAPILPQIEVNLSGRYDRYSGGVDNFSPKAGVKFKPIDQVVLRGTYSRGFRIPSFGEANATFPTTGFVPANVGIYEDFFLNQHGCSLATYEDDCPAYVQTTSYGQTSLPNVDLKPEKSRSFTAGIFVEPMRRVTIGVDYYNIKKSNAITTANNTPALHAYYSGLPIPAGYTVVPDAPDVNNPTAQPRIAFVQAAFINATTVRSEGLDFSFSAAVDLTDDLEWSTQGEASYIIDLSTSFPDGSVESYEGTLGNFNLTSGNGTPEWKATWLNSLKYKKLTINGTLNYYDGYNFSAEDQEGPGTAGKSGLATGALGNNVPKYITFDLGASVEVDDRFTIYAIVQNLFDNLPPFDDVTYGAHLYNAVQGGEGIYGRYMKVGVKIGL